MIWIERLLVAAILIGGLIGIVTGAIRLCPKGGCGAHLTKSSPQSINNATPTVIIWDTE